MLKNIFQFIFYIIIKYQKNNLFFIKNNSYNKNNFKQINVNPFQTGGHG
jgi:hypothetical protein